MPRIYLPSISEEKKALTLKGETARYLISVLRVKKGDGIVLFDSEGRHFGAKIIKKERSAVIVEILGTLGSLPEPETSVILVQSLLKGRKMDLVVQKATELWVSEIVPVVTERSQIRGTRKTERWRKIAIEASRQCGRAAPPAVHDPQGFSDCLESLRRGSGGLRMRGYIFCEVGGEDLGRSVPGGGGDVIAAVGPEGGFTEDEVFKAREAGLKLVTLGGPVLRAETAAISGVALLQYLLGNI
jgi:16S rRNA (uracil1498-N3)-methyltransferase